MLYSRTHMAAVGVKGLSSFHSEISLHCNNANPSELLLCQANMEEFKVKVEDILKENTRLHIRIEQIQAVGPVGMTTW